MILPIYAALERMDRSLIEAGKDLYGTPLQTFLHVTLPQTKQGILAGCVLVFLPAVGDFVSAQLLGGPDTYMVGNLIQDQFFAANNWPFGSALTVVMMLFLLDLDGRLPALGGPRRDGAAAHDEPRRRSTEPRVPARRDFDRSLVYAVPVRRRSSSSSCSRSTRSSRCSLRRLLAAVVRGVPQRPERCASRCSPRSRSPWSR